ncbi:MAG: MOSC domain-containing protein [Nocardioides sp.]|nr:MOSC domain-containing protein [Nocardioides sp.]
MDGVYRYPVKSLRGHRLDTAVVEPWGLAGDRRWMVVDDRGRAVTAREIPSMLLLSPEPTEDGLLVHAPDRRPLHVAFPDPGRQVPVSLWKSELTAAADEDAHDWFSTVLGRRVRLVHLDAPTRRTVDPRFGAPDDRVSFADGFPLLVATTASLDALNAALACAPVPGPQMTMERFRPNLVVDGAEAWGEDDWRRVRIGGTTFRAVKGCGRCVMTTIDPDTAEKQREPIPTLARLRRWDGQVWFGVNLVPDDPGAVVSVGDVVEVLEAVGPADRVGPLRAGVVPEAV